MTVDHEIEETKGRKRLVWTAAAFYTLIAFEFFYMASPFAAYFYTVYGPGMDLLQSLPVADWTLWFFLPHLVAETQSQVINALDLIGTALFFGGLLGFALGAIQVYRAKLLGKGAVTTGVYRFIRHPQYTALMIASIGMLLIWPRFLVLFSTAAVILAYALLARSEERHCLLRYPAYDEYRASTGMFLPRLFRISPNRAPVGAVTIVVSILAGVVLATWGAFALRSATIHALYTQETDAGVFLSVARINHEDLEMLAQIALADPAVQDAVYADEAWGGVLAYVLPSNMYVSEVPMVLPVGETFGHGVPDHSEPLQWKVVLTRAVFGAGYEGGEILFEAVNKSSLIEVHIDLTTRRITQRHAPPEDAFYQGRQVPIF